MDRINDPTATEDRKFREASGELSATRLRALWLNGMQEEMASFIENEGIELSGADLTQLRQALDRRFPRWRDAVTQVANVTELRGLTGLVDGQIIYLAEDGSGGAGNYIIQTAATPESLPDVIVLDDGKRAVLQPAASNVTSAISQAETDANNYTDAAEVAAKSYADTVADQAETDANAYTDAQLTSFAAGAAGVFADTAAGLAGTAEGDYFNVPSPLDTETYIVYRHDAGPVATEIGRTPSSTAVTEARERAEIGADYVEGYDNVQQVFYIDYMMCIEDSAGVLRVIEESTGSDYQNYSADSSNVEIESQSEVAGYPELIRVVPDAAGVLRVVYRLDDDIGVNHYSEDSSDTPVPTEYVLFLMAGQSNAHGSSRDPENSPVPTAGWAYYWNSVDLSPLEDPWATASYGSAWPSFAIKFTELTGKGVILVDGATGGTAMAPAADIGNGYWGGAGGGLRENAVADLNACITHLRSASYAYQFGGVLWSQGERDAQSIDASTITKADYTSAWANFIAYMRGELGDFWPFVFSRTGSKDSGDTAGFQDIRDAQDSICAADQFVLMGFTGALNFPALGMMYDDLHYDQAGLNKMGEAMAFSCAQLSASTAIAI